MVKHYPPQARIVSVQQLKDYYVFDSHNKNLNALDRIVEPFYINNSDKASQVIDLELFDICNEYWKTCFPEDPFESLIVIPVSLESADNLNLLQKLKHSKFLQDQIETEIFYRVQDDDRLH